MAIPFNVPEHEDEVEVILNQLQALLTKLQAALRRSRLLPNQLQQVSTSRARPSGQGRSDRARDQGPSTSSTVPSHIPDLLSNLAWLAVAGQDAVNLASGSGASHLTTNASISRSPRRRTSSESSNCEETKISITAILNNGVVQDWNQVGVVTLRKIAGDSALTPLTEVIDGPSTSQSPAKVSTEGFLSKILPGPISAPLWTAMICFVGWHLFRAR